jgi:uncharacterized protein YggE
MFLFLLVLSTITMGYGEQPCDLAMTSRTISVTGTSKIDMPADYAKVYFTMEVESKLEEAQARFAELEGKILSLSNAFGLEPGSFSFDYLYINLKQGTFLKAEKINFTKSGSVKVKKINAVPALVSELLKIGVRVNPSIGYEISDMGKIKMMAFEKALEAAKAKADLVASQFGVKTMQLLRFTEVPEAGYYNANRQVAQSNVSYSSNEDVTSTMSGPRVVYQLTVYVVFQL